MTAQSTMTNNKSTTCESYELYGMFATHYWSPKAIAVDSNGGVYVGCSGFWGGLEKYSRSSATASYVQKWQFSESATQYAVRGLTVSPTGNLLATVRQEREGDESVQVFSPDGRLLSQWGESGDGKGQFRAPAGIACDRSGNSYLVEAPHKGYSAGNCIHLFDARGVFQLKWGASGLGDGEFNLPTGIALDKHGYVHVADTYSSRIQIFAPDGTFSAKWGTHGVLPGQLNCPQGLAFDDADNCYLADTGNNRVQKFSPDGSLLAYWGRRGTQLGEFWLPCGIAVDHAGLVYVADTANDRVQVFRPYSEKAR